MRSKTFELAVSLQEIPQSEEPWGSVIKEMNEEIYVLTALVFSNGVLGFCVGSVGRPLVSYACEQWVRMSGVTCSCNYLIIALEKKKRASVWFFHLLSLFHSFCLFLCLFCLSHHHNYSINNNMTVLTLSVLRCEKPISF